MTKQLSDKAQNLKNMFSKFRNQEQKVYFDYRNIPSSKNLDYEILSYDNYENLIHMFKDDSNPFIINDFKNKAELDVYMVNVLEVMYYSSKRGGMDYFFKTKEGVYAGVLHLHDLNSEKNKEHTCSINFATKADFRKKGITTEAVKSLFKHIKNHYKREEVFTSISKKNLAAQRFLEKIGFELNFDFPLDKKEKYYQIDLSKI